MIASTSALSIITGAARGIGAACACEVGVLAIPCDISSEVQVGALAVQTQHELGLVDVFDAHRFRARRAGAGAAFKPP
jgi:hypothetical protein